MKWVMAAAAGLYLYSAAALACLIWGWIREKKEVKVKRMIEKETAEALPYANKWIRWITMFEKSRKDTQVLFTKHALLHGVFLESRIHGEGDSLLFIIHDEKVMNIFLQAVDHILADRLLPKVTFSVLFTDHADGSAEQDLACWMRDHKKHYDICISDRHSVGAGSQAYIGVHRKAMMHLRQDPVYISDEKKYTGIDPLWKQVGQYLNWTERLELYIPFLQQEGIETLCKVYPAADRFFASRCIAAGEDILISAADDAQAEKSLTYIRREAYKKHCSLTMLHQFHGSSPAKQEHQDMICRAIRQTMPGVKPICILYDDTSALALEKLCTSILMFAPLGVGFDNQRAVDFYSELLLPKKY